MPNPGKTQGFTKTYFIHSKSDAIIKQNTASGKYQCTLVITVTNFQGIQSVQYKIPVE
jgi:hypothetical protein